MSAVAMTMSEKKPETPFCVYGSVKVDKEVIRLAKIAALTDQKSFQEWVSDALNLVAAKTIKGKPIARKPPRPKS